MAMLNNQMVYMVTICHNGLMWFMYVDFPIENGDFP